MRVQLNAVTWQEYACCVECQCQCQYPCQCQCRMCCEAADCKWTRCRRVPKLVRRGRGRGRPRRAQTMDGFAWKLKELVHAEWLRRGWRFRSQALPGQVREVIQHFRRVFACVCVCVRLCLCLCLCLRLRVGVSAYGSRASAQPVHQCVRDRLTT